MIFIDKASAPKELDKLMNDAKVKGLSGKDAYEMLRNPLKSEVREALMREQGHLCAYCMRKIPDQRITSDDTDLSDIYIEHIKPRSDNLIPGYMALDYNNLLAVCSGNEKAPEARNGKKKRFLTCDKKRGRRKLTVNPLDVKTLSTIYYSENGEILSTDKAIEEDINCTLNLNCKSDAVTLPQNRKAVLDEIERAVAMSEKNILDSCIEYLEIFENESDPKTPYIGIAIWWLKTKIKDLSDEKKKLLSNP